MYYIGIDVGRDGGIAVLSENGLQVDSWIFSEVRLREVCKQYKGNCKCIVEKVWAMPHQGVKSTFNFGRNFGYILGVLEANSIPYLLVAPLRWKHEYGVTSDKSTSIAMCQKLFPDHNLMRSKRAKKPHDGRAEAILIAEYGRRHSF